MVQYEIEPLTSCIQKVEQYGIEPQTSCMLSRRSTN